MTKKKAIANAIKAIRKSKHFDGLDFINACKIAKAIVKQYGIYNDLCVYDPNLWDGCKATNDGVNGWYDYDGYFVVYDVTYHVTTDWGCKFTYHYNINDN